MKEYIVSLKRGIDYDQFWNEIENESLDDGFVPSRRVEIANNRDVSLRMCHYYLSEEEATLLRNDPRVLEVELPTKFKPMTSKIQTGDFSKTTSDTGNYVNWGLRRCISTTNPYGTGATADNNYTYCLDGTGVDIVIQDSGLQVDHPEFQDANGVSRVQQIDWYDESGVSGTMPAGHYSDYDGHGTHVAGIAAGKTYGWAKNAHIYSVKVAGLEGAGDTTGIDVPDCFDVIIGWHNAKKAAGNNRPTVVNMSWGYNDYFADIDGGVYRGTPWSGNSRRTDYGMIGYNTGTSFAHGVRVTYIDVSIQEMIDAGIVVCIAAGNSYQKIDVPFGQDYDNYYVGGYFNGALPNYYHRGSSPYDDQAIIVGSIDTVVYDAVTDQKSSFSCTGPGVDIYSPGSNIMSATSTTNVYNDGAYPQDSAFRICNISGTSMASPQVCGLSALYMQMNPTFTPERLKHRILKSSIVDIHTTVNNNAYTDSRSLLGGSQRLMHNQYNNAVGFTISGGLSANVGQG